MCINYIEYFNYLEINIEKCFIFIGDVDCIVLNN